MTHQIRSISGVAALRGVAPAAPGRDWCGGPHAAPRPCPRRGDPGSCHACPALPLMRCIPGAATPAGLFLSPSRVGFRLAGRRRGAVAAT